MGQREETVFKYDPQAYVLQGGVAQANTHTQRKKFRINNSCPRECKLVQPLWKTAWRFLKKLKAELPYDPTIALLVIYPRDKGVLFQRDTCIPMFIAALSTIAKVWEEPKCPSMDEWIKKTWYIYIQWSITQQ